MKGYVFIIIFILVTAFGFDAYYLNEDGKSNMWEIYLVFGASSTFALSIFALWGYYEYIREEDEIEILFSLENKEIETGLKVLRKNCTRAELQGLLRILSNGKTFDMASVLRDKKILHLVNDIQTGKGKKIIIEIQLNELEQFKNLPDYINLMQMYEVVKPPMNTFVSFTRQTQSQIDTIFECAQKYMDNIGSTQK